MVQRIKLNLEEIESMLYFWQATNDKEKVAETYLHEIASLPGLSSSWMIASLMGNQFVRF